MNTRWQLLQYLFRSSCYVSVFCVFCIYKAIYLFSGQDVPLSSTSPWSLFPSKVWNVLEYRCWIVLFVWICNVEIPRFLQRLEAHSHGDLIECICLQPKLIDSWHTQGPLGASLWHDCDTLTHSGAPGGLALTWLWHVGVSAGLTQDISDEMYATSLSYQPWSARFLFSRSLMLHS